MENLQVKESDVASFAGLALLVPTLLGVVKGLFKQWVAGKEPLVCVALTYLIGVTAKLTIPLAFGGVGWLVCLVGFLIVAGAAAQVHDFFINKVMKGKLGPPDSAPPTGGA